MTRTPTPWYWEVELVQQDYDPQRIHLLQASGVSTTGGYRVRLYLDQKPTEEEIRAWSHKPHQCQYAYFPMWIEQIFGGGSVQTTPFPDGLGYRRHIKLVVEAEEYFHEWELRTKRTL